ncbi:DUF4097 family beta strand repeat-containing protein [Herbiconiux sp.]|uniref:DUF4097 family beta strand repeat-containing protein n=1 Tax=Herbiconiux sp. TaxID=1871186 RepID=UPI0025C5A0B2|nr:DUF4097 family beta strand repeat-containing protein [Herbiconiux sp.]
MTTAPNTLPAFPPPAPAPKPDRTLRNALLALGSALIVGLLLIGGVQFALAGTGEDQSGSYTQAGSFRTLDIDTSAANVSVRYGTVSEARIDFDSGGSPLRYEQRLTGDTLEVGVHNRGWWIFGIVGGFEPATLQITLPSALAPVAVSLESSAGNSDLDGDFAALDLESSAGNIQVTGSADSLHASSSAGDLTADDLAVSGEVETESSAGTTELTFTALPSSIEMDSSAGDIRVALPSGSYEIRTDTSVGSVELGVPSTPGASRQYSFETSAGDIVLLPAP